MHAALHATQSKGSAHPDKSFNALEERIQQALKDSPYRSLRGIHCRVHEGLVMLQGTVPNYHCVQIAISIAMAHLNDETALRINLQVEYV